jgi:hypothetical protein
VNPILQTGKVVGIEDGRIWRSKAALGSKIQAHSLSPRWEQPNQLNTSSWSMDIKNLIVPGMAWYVMAKETLKKLVCFVV